jgi:hypothetical protein
MSSRSIVLCAFVVAAYAGCTDDPAGPGTDAAASVASAGTVPNPVVTGPITQNAVPGSAGHDYTFFSTDVDLASAGYVEEEYFLEGDARLFAMPALATGAPTGAAYAYRTRMVVRRPASAAAFNGSVLMEWLNVTGAFDLDGLWMSNREHLMRHGYAWIGVSAQRLGIHAPVSGLRAWSPTRYGTLDVTAGGTFTNDTLAYDIFSQAAQAVRYPSGADPLGGLHVRQLIAVGISQSANRLVPYYNSVQPVTGLFDGFLLIGGGGLLRTGAGPKAFKVLSETDLNNQAQAAWRQPPSTRFRRWEVAGAAHFDYDVVTAMLPVQLRDLGMTLSLEGCEKPPLSRIPYTYVVSAVLEHLRAWVRNGKAPPVAPDIATTADGPPATIVRDTFGNALGGIRLSQHAVPTATSTGINGPMTAGWCRTFGSWVPFSQETLAALYPTHQLYKARVIEATHAAQRAGFILGRDAAETIAAAAASEIGRW